ncbi:MULTISPECIES: hypothetical protein [unclassified Isoptericola]|uniref:hypothetical protein n=1 Tax=unclassified Isoptericola TaxID=2623355 RepID=UPI00364C9245
MTVPTPGDPAGAPVWENYVVAQLTQASLGLVPRDALALGVEVDGVEEDDVAVTVVCQARHETPDLVEDVDEIAQELAVLLGHRVHVGSRIDVRAAPRITPSDRPVWVFVAREDR